MAAGYNWPQYSVHRGDLQVMLLAAVRDRLGPDSVQPATALAELRQDGDRVLSRLVGRDGRDAGDGRVGSGHRRRRAALDGAGAAASGRGPRALERHHDVARLRGGRAVPHRQDHDVGGQQPDGEVRGVPDLAAARGWTGPDQLGRGGAGRGRRDAAAGLEPSGEPGRCPAALPGLEHGRGGRVRADGFEPEDPGVPDGRPGRAAFVGPRPGDAGRRRGAPDVSDRVQRRVAGHSGRAPPGSAAGAARRRPGRGAGRVRGAAASGDGGGRGGEPEVPDGPDPDPRGGPCAAGVRGDRGRAERGGAQGDRRGLPEHDGVRRRRAQCDGLRSRCADSLCADTLGASAPRCVDFQCADSRPGPISCRVRPRRPVAGAAPRPPAA